MPVLYLDILLALNLLIDFLLLCATAACCHLPRRRLRLVLGAAIGSLSACAILLPAFPIGIQLLYDTATAAGMIGAAFPWNGWRVFGKALVTLWLISALFAGICTAIQTLFSPAGLTVFNGVVYDDIPPLTLIVLTILSYGIISLYERFARPRLFGRHLYRITAEYRGRAATFTALYDSGNTLTEPFSGAPAIVVEATAIQALIGRAPTAGEAAIPSGFRLLPYRSIGREGVLPAFAPERLTVQIDGGRSHDISGSYLAVTERLGRDTYAAVLGDDIAQLIDEERKRTS